MDCLYSMFLVLPTTQSQHPLIDTDSLVAETTKQGASYLILSGNQSQIHSRTKGSAFRSNLEFIILAKDLDAQTLQQPPSDILLSWSSIDPSSHFILMISFLYSNGFLAVCQRILDYWTSNSFLNVVSFALHNAIIYCCRLSVFFFLHPAFIDIHLIPLSLCRPHHPPSHRMHRPFLETACVRRVLY